MDLIQSFPSHLLNIAPGPYVSMVSTRTLYTNNYIFSKLDSKQLLSDFFDRFFERVDQKEYFLQINSQFF